ncbi:MAG: phosphate/phosphite/phosphonate ABC transporter substrate-binding protein [Nitrospiraceae bacterium]|nr:MAG: phosphate/phosphite/phosphonate ABC transporter substrate-binding protein [Nitrospiraceae bacterium]
MKYDLSALIELSITLCLCFVLAAGCKKSEPPSSGNDNVPDAKTLRIGLIPERNIFEQMEQYEPLAEYIYLKTGTRIELKVLTRYGNIVDNFISLNLDGAFFGSFTYTLARAKLGVEPVARPENEEGISTYYGVIFVRKDSGIKSVADMKGRTFAFVDRATTAGYLLPIAFFKDNGISDYRTFLKEAYFTGTHEDAIFDVLNKKADIGAAKNTVYYEMARTNSRIEDELTILTRSPDVPQNSLALRNGIDSSVKKMLKETLLNMHDDEEGRKVLKKFNARRFVETKDSDYKGVYTYIKKVDMYFTLSGYGDGP